MDQLDDETLAPFPHLSLQTIHTLDHPTLDKLNERFLTLQHTPTFIWENQPLPKSTDSVRILAITWNMHGKKLGSQLKKLFVAPHHLVVMGTQECQRSIGLSLFCDSKQEWEREVQEALGKDFAMVASNKLNALHICVFAHQTIATLVEEFSIASMATGFLNVVGNKGGVAVSLRINRKRFLFFNCHLASGQNVQKERNLELKRLQTDFPMEREEGVPLHHRYDYTIWMGDFNSRINDIHFKDLGVRSFQEMLLKDQLLQSRIQGGATSEFGEGMIYFPPTYKLQPNDPSFTLGKEWRIPGWTDRIIYHVRNDACKSMRVSKTQVVHLDESQMPAISNNQMTLVNYDSGTNCFGSDHRPVFAQFTALL